MKGETGEQHQRRENAHKCKRREREKHGSPEEQNVFH
jgi:hypothetical protein